MGCALLSNQQTDGYGVSGVSSDTHVGGDDASQTTVALG